MPDGELTSGDLAHIRRQLASGNAVLFTGAGFSLSTQSQDGSEVPGTDDLKRLIWNLAYPNAPYEDDTDLPAIYGAALRRNRGALVRLLRDVFTIRSETVPASYRSWLNAPWLRMYTLNVDDLERATAAKYDLSRDITSLSALRDGVPGEAGRSNFCCVHLNGRAQDFPDVTFSASEYGDRVALPDIWLQQLGLDITYRPVIFVGTELDEPPLWQQIAIRQQRRAGAPELRARGYLVTPKLSRARREVLGGFNVVWLSMSHQEFAERVRSMRRPKNSRPGTTRSGCAIRLFPIGAQSAR